MQASKLLHTAIQKQAGFNFKSAKKHLSELIEHCPDSPEFQEAKDRLPFIDALINEKQTYERINENAKQVLTDIGMNIAGGTGSGSIHADVTGPLPQYRFICNLARALAMAVRNSAGSPSRIP